MNNIPISYYTPSTMPEALLKQLFVARHNLLETLIKRIKKLGQTSSPHHTIIIGPRGAGKTHLISLIYYHAKKIVSHDSETELRIAWLPEDPWNICSYKRLLIEILRATSPIPDLKDLPINELDARLRHTCRTGGPILVLVENFDQILEAFGNIDQQRLRNLLQTESNILLIASTTRLDRNLSGHASPFFEYFDAIHLQPFSPEEARQMLLTQARVANNDELADFLSTDAASSRIHTIAHLAGGQPRLWALLGSALTVESLNELTTLLLSRFDDLTPYYQEQLARLSRMQRLIVAELSAADRPLAVKELAERIGYDQRSTAKAVSDLNERAWLKPVSTIFADLLDKRRTYYDLAEPLARLAFQIKETRGEPLPLIIDFLVNWFDATQLRPFADNDYCIAALSKLESDQCGSLAKRLTSLATSRIKSLDLLGQVEDALAAVAAGDAEPVMALPSSLRQAIELRAQDDTGLIRVRLTLLSDALREVGNVPRDGRNAAWIARAERLDIEAQSPESRLMLVRWFAASWHFDDAEAALSTITSDLEHMQGADAIASTYESAGRLTEAITLFEQTLTDRIHVLGDNHPDTLDSRNNLAGAYESAGRLTEAITLFEQTLTDRVRVLGDDHPDTLALRNNLASAYESAGRLTEAITLFEQTLDDCIRILGGNHPRTLALRNNLAGAYESAGRLTEAITLYEQTLTDRTRILSEDHPNTLTSRNNLAYAYESAGRLTEAITLYEQTLTDRTRILSEDHPDTLTSRNNLAGAYESAGHLTEATTLYEQTLTDCIRVLGPDHPDTLTSRNNLARVYKDAGFPKKATALLEGTTPTEG